MIGRSLLALLYLLIVTPPLSVVCLVVIFLGDHKGRIWWVIAKFWVEGFIKCGGIGNIKIYGREKLDNIHSAIFMFNHISYLDPPVLVRLFPKSPIRFFAKHTLARVPLFGQALWATGQIFINRKNREKAFENINKAIKKIKNRDFYFIVAPEGRRSPTDELLPFKVGGFVMAIKTNLPIVPVAIAGTREILPSGFILREKSPIVIIVGDPVMTDSYDERNQDKLISLVREEVASLQKKAIQIRKEIIKSQV